MAYMKRHTLVHLAENWSLRNEKVVAVPQVAPVNYENIHTWKSPMVYWPKDNDLQNTKIEQHQQGEFGCSGRVISSCSTSGTRPCYFHQKSSDKSWTRKGWEFITTNVASKQIHKQNHDHSFVSNIFISNRDFPLSVIWRQRKKKSINISLYSNDLFVVLPNISVNHVV